VDYTQLNCLYFQFLLKNFLKISSNVRILVSKRQIILLVFFFSTLPDPSHLRVFYKEKHASLVLPTRQELTAVRSSSH